MNLTELKQLSIDLGFNLIEVTEYPKEGVYYVAVWNLELTVCRKLYKLEAKSTFKARQAKDLHGVLYYKNSTFRDRIVDRNSFAILKFICHLKFKDDPKFKKQTRQTVIKLGNDIALLGNSGELNTQKALLAYATYRSTNLKIFKSFTNERRRN